jgi:hypothetical protein
MHSPGCCPAFLLCRGFDVFVNMVLEDVTEYEITPEGKKVGWAGWEDGLLPPPPPSFAAGAAALGLPTD